MSSLWKQCRCGAKMKTTNCWDFKTRLFCASCGLVRHVQHIKVTEIVAFRVPQKNSQIATGSKK